LAAHSALQHDLDAYLAEFGGRFPNELKLEQASPLDSFALQASMLLAAAAHPLAPADPDDGSSMPWGIRKLRQFVRQREELRLLRSTAFGWLRRLLLASGTHAAREGWLRHAEDVFWLTREEWLDGQPAQWAAAVTQRQADYAKFPDQAPPRSFAWMPGEAVPSANAVAARERLEGTRVVPGRLTGRVLVMPEFQPAPWPEFDLLVARHTDPGWSLLLAQSKGLIIEHGGLLSHASIVARELGIPTLVGVAGATDWLATGDQVVLDATAGTVHRTS
ncbi:MAG: PEP-utilizing enzyme, partial [Schleiferiaceae bacterium]